MIEINVSETAEEEMISKTGDFKQVLEQDCKFPAGIGELLRKLVLHHARNDPANRNRQTIFSSVG